MESYPAIRLFTRIAFVLSWIAGGAVALAALIGFVRLVVWALARHSSGFWSS